MRSGMQCRYERFLFLSYGRAIKKKKGEECFSANIFTRSGASISRGGTERIQRRLTNGANLVCFLWCAVLLAWSKLSPGCSVPHGTGFREPDSFGVAMFNCKSMGRM